jgi:Spy/CpxP family protein refolding chaperone
MNRWINRIITFASITSALALVPAGVAFAQDGTPQTAQHAKGHKGEHRKGLVGAALKLESLTPDQRTQIEQLLSQRRAAAKPVRQADAQVLGVLAQQVFADKMDTQALAPSLAVERLAVAQERSIDALTLDRLHSILTPAQRTELVDKIEARMAKGPRAGEGANKGGGWKGGGKLGLSEQQREQVKANLQASRPATGNPQRGQMKAALESFKGDAFNAGALARPADPGDREVRLTQAMLPVLTPNQRAAYADMLQHRAEHATHAKKA